MKVMTTWSATWVLAGWTTLGCIAQTGATEPARIPPVPSPRTVERYGASADQAQTPVITPARSRKADYLQQVSSSSITQSRKQSVRSIQDIQFVTPKHSHAPLATSWNADREAMPPVAANTAKLWVSHRTVHQPLLYHDTPLEREGKTQSPNLQPFTSMARFAIDTMLAPFRSLRYSPRSLHHANSPR